SISVTKKSSLNLLRLEEELSMAHLRLARVFIENQPYEKFIIRFDRPGTFFYMDPPYYGCEDYYGKDIFKREDYSNLAGILREISGKFIMSINDVPEIWQMFRTFHIETIDTSYTTPGAHRRKKVSELLIMNYEPTKAR
ncbi:MAG: DNA adenine methylase, partial [Deltaproteobacteria bacterium]|nr:DNA adenine methylase [Deltaproteobacteria bacterium]